MDWATGDRPSLMDLNNPFARIRQQFGRIRQISLGSDSELYFRASVNLRTALLSKTLRAAGLTPAPARLRAVTERRRAAIGVTPEMFGMTFAENAGES